MKKKGVVEFCEPTEGQFISTYFLVPKPDGTKRFILNLKRLNEFVDTAHFKMEDMRTVTKLVSPNVYMCTLDLKDAYYLINIAKESRKLLRFYFSGQLYQFTALPFGLCTSPLIFTKIMKPVVQELRKQGFLSTIYLDDILLLGDTYSTCLTNLQSTKELLISLGFVINFHKSSTIPNTRCKFLGFIIDSRSYSIELTTEKRIRLKELVQKMSNKKTCKIRTFANLVGSLIAACPALSYGWLYTKQAERQKHLALLNNGGDYEGSIKIRECLQPDFNWWLKHLGAGYNPIRRFEFRLEIFSDATLIRWGAYASGQTTGGFWNQKERSLHINHLELLAATLALKSFASDLYDCEILLRVDNTTAVAYINRMGGVKFPALTKLARDIWQWAERHKIWLFASYIASTDNHEADKESRRIGLETEWELSDDAYRIITLNFGLPKIDLFASRVNTKCINYCSWRRDPDSVAIDAFTISWTNFFFYAFPPFILILKVLRKIINDRACGILVVPFWPTQPWFPVFKSLLMKEVITFKPDNNLLMSPCRSVQHPLSNNLTLIAGMLSGRPTGTGIYRKKQSQS